MPDNTITRTNNGWPLIDDANYIRVLPTYTQLLADKLDSADADVAAASNAATRAQAAAAQVPIIHGAVIDRGQQTGHYTAVIDFPAGKFSRPPLCTVSHLDGSAAAAKVSCGVESVSATQVRIAWRCDPPTTRYRAAAHYIAVQIGV